MHMCSALCSTKGCNACTWLLYTAVYSSIRMLAIYYQWLPNTRAIQGRYSRRRDILPTHMRLCLRWDWRLAHRLPLWQQRRLP